MTPIQEIESLFVSRQPAADEHVQAWARSEDLEVRGALLTLFDHGLADPAALGERERAEAYLGFFLRCIRENPAGHFVESRYAAAHSLVRWYLQVRLRSGSAAQALLAARAALRDLYVNGNDEIRRAIVTGVLEHLLEQSQVRADFADWDVDPTLHDAYEEALQWSHGAP